MSIPFKWINQISNGNTQKIESSNRDSGNSYSELNTTQQKIISQMKENPHISIQKMSEACGKDVSTIKKAVAALKKIGFIKRIGANKNGSWQVLK